MSGIANLLRGVRALWRMLCVVAHIFWGVYVMRRYFGRAGRQERQQHVAQWAQRLMRLCGVTLRVAEGALLDDHVMLVCNHLSWLDVFVISATGGTRFISKDDVRDWPLIKYLVLGTGTLLLNRTSKRAAYELNQQIAAQLQAGERLCFFPEGTTTNGPGMLPFRASLLEGVTQAGARVQPLALRYLKPDGTPSVAPIYIDDTSLVQSIWWLLTAPGGVIAELHILPALPPGLPRREWANLAEQAIRRTLGFPSA